MVSFEKMEVELERRREKHKDDGGYIAVDFDGTVAEFESGDGAWVAWNEFGAPIPVMVERIKGWIQKGYTVKIFTARLPEDQDPQARTVCPTTGYAYARSEMIEAISDYCWLHIGKKLEAINIKSHYAIEFWDDRAVQVVPNTGRTLAEEHAAELSALKGAP